MVVYKNQIHSKKRRGRPKKRTSDVIVQNWHLECHEEGSRLWKLTMALAIEENFNDLFVTAFTSNDGKLLCNSLGD